MAKNYHRSYNTRVARVALAAGVSLFPILASGCVTPVSDEYETCEPVPPATDCGDDVTIEVE